MSERQVLPLNSKNCCVSPRTPMRFANRPRRGAFMLERVFISGAGTGGGAADWLVHDIEIGGVSKLATKDLPATLFAAGGGVVAGKHGHGQLVFAGLTIEKDEEVALVVSYVGANPEGVPFYASIVGDRPPQRPTVLPIATRASIKKATIRVRIAAALKITQMEIENGHDWIINDVRVDGKSAFRQDGDIPGDMFATGSIDSFVEWPDGRFIELDVTHVGYAFGASPDGDRFVGKILSHTNDYVSRPPDVDALVSCENEEEKVTARCDWRPPPLPYSAELGGA